MAFCLDSHMIHLCFDRLCFPLQRGHKMFGCSSCHHLTCLSPLPTCASSSHLEHAHAPTQMHSSYQKYWRVIAFSPNVESCTVNWKKPYIHYNRISEHGVGGELLPSTGNNLNANKRPGIKGLFFFISPHQENISSLIRDWERLKGFLLMQCVLKIMELYRFLCCPFWGRWAFWSGH